MFVFDGNPGNKTRKKCHADVQVVNGKSHEVVRERDHKKPTHGMLGELSVIIIKKTLQLPKQQMKPS